MIHATPFGYPPGTNQERHQDAAEALLAAQDAEFVPVRFGESPATHDAVQAIIRQCFEASAEYAKRQPEMELNYGGENATHVVMAQAEYIGFANETLRQILQECRRLT